MRGAVCTSVSIKGAWSFSIIVIITNAYVYLCYLSRTRSPVVEEDERIMPVNFLMSRGSLISRVAGSNGILRTIFDR